MPNAFMVLKSNKIGLDAVEGYVVVRNGISYLRILGGEPKWTVMTATASEDHGRIPVCPDRLRLVESALRLCAKYGDSPVAVETDWRGREYVKIGTITRNSEESEADFLRENEALFRQFFEVFDSYKSLGSRNGSEMRELYGSLTIDDGCGEVYLSDGMWLSSDGELHDRGR